MAVPPTAAASAASAASPSIAAMPPMRFLVTGGARGLGRGLSRCLAKQGHHVFILDTNQVELDHTLRVHLPSAGVAGKVGGTLCNIGNQDSVRAAFADARRFFHTLQGGQGDGGGGTAVLDVVVNNAGKAMPYWANGKDLTEASVDEWHEWLDTNLTGCFLVSKESVPMLRATPQRPRGGCIVHISSARARQSEPNQEGYASTKAGVLGLNHALASSLSPYGIRSNAILPGWFPVSHESKRGDELGLAWDHELTQTDRDQFWTRRPGTVEDFTQGVLFCAANGFLTGQEIVLDGGMEKKMIYLE